MATNAILEEAPFCPHFLYSSVPYLVVQEAV